MKTCWRSDGAAQIAPQRVATKKQQSRGQRQDLPDSRKLFQGFDILLIQDFDDCGSHFVFYIGVTLFHNDIASTLYPELLVELCREKAEQVTSVGSLSLCREDKTALSSDKTCRADKLVESSHIVSASEYLPQICYYPC